MLPAIIATLRLPAAPWRHRGGRRTARSHQILGWHGGPPQRGHRRHPARLAHGRSCRGSDRGLGDPAGPGAAPSRAGDHLLSHLRAHGDRPFRSGACRRGCAGRIHGGHQGRGHGLCGQRPGEAREADLGVAGGRDKGIIFRKGEVIRSVKGQDALLAAFMEELQRLLKEKETH